jgi:hypothetical protein
VVGLLTAAGGTSGGSATVVNEHVTGGSALSSALTSPATVTTLRPRTVELLRGSILSPALQRTPNRELTPVPLSC